MRIAFMGRLLSYEGYGVKTFIDGLLRGIQNISRSHEIYVFVNQRQYLSLAKEFPDFSVVPLAPKTDSFVGKLIWDHIAVGRACKSLKIDAILNPAHVRPLYVTCPAVVVVHDMMYHLFPNDWNRSERYYFQTAVSKLTSCADRIVAASNNTKNDILRILKVPKEKVEVIYYGVPEGFKKIDCSSELLIRNKYNLSKPFILGVGSYHPRKNLVQLIDSFENMSSRAQHDLVLVGPTHTWKNAELETRLENSKVRHRIRTIGLVARDELPLFYNAAEVFVFPSLYEGFGFPVLEAMACGCPVITSNVSSLPEVGGEAAMLVDPHDSHNISEAILQVLENKELSTEMKSRSLLQASNFSWSKTAQKILTLLEAVTKY